MSVLKTYFNELGQTVTSGWNRFWFAPSPTSVVALLRIAVGLTALYYVIGYSVDLLSWFSADGVQPLQSLRVLAGDARMYRVSVFFLTESPTLIWIIHVTSIIVLAAFTVGLFSRATCIASWLIVLSYVHRAPLLVGPFEPILCMALFYLCLAPTGRVASIDAWWRRKRVGAEQAELEAKTPSIFANVATRLIQIHLVGFYVLMGLTKLSGETWWFGEGIWSLVASSEGRFLDFSGLATQSIIINLWSHAIVFVELGFAVLIWVRVLRPAVITVATIHWIALALVTGLFDLGFVMVACSLAFVGSTVADRLLRRQRPAIGDSL